MGHRFGDDRAGGGGYMEIELFIGCVVLFAAWQFSQEYSATKKKVEDVEKENTNLHKEIESMNTRITKLEKSQRLRMPWTAMENLLDAKAAINLEKEQFQFFVSLMENADAHLDKALKTGTKREEE